ncbi:MAG: hypothetical protein QOH63_936 [Acidobacteriota bacterium]|jgi:hypothetical protein|nr:hypothetical protein [Acidobacteriota bacterium]
MRDETKVKYDVFISYRWVKDDQTWVRQQLVPALVNAGLAVCLDVNDFVPGRDLIREMTRAGTQSRRAICVISPDYFDGDRMVTFESLMIRRFDPSGSESRLIPLLYRATDIPEELRGLIPIDWTDLSGRSREWKKLLQVLGAKNLNAPDPDALSEYKGLSYEELEILNILKKFYGFGFSKFPNIPPDTLATARKVCEVPKDETILGLIVLGPQKDYLLLGRSGIYFRTILKSLNSAAIPYANFPDRTFDWGKTFFDRLSKKVTLGNGQFVIAINISPDTLVELLNTIKEAVKNGKVAASS